MTIATVRMASAALQRPVTYTAILPDPSDVGPGPYPVLVQLHGHGDDHRAWIYKSNLALYVEHLPLIVVMPSGDNFYWMNWTRDLLYEDFVVQDLRAHVEQTFPARPGAPWAIGGLSMGGFGAIRLGLKHPGRFCSIYAHSSTVPAPAELQKWHVIVPHWSDDFQTTMKREADCYEWAAALPPDRFSRLTFDCGAEDYLLDQNRRFHAFLQERALPHRYLECPGAHSWDYWDRHVPAALQQHAEVFGIREKPRE